jgi:hypothetical protein
MLHAGGVKDEGGAVTEVDDELMFADIPRTESLDALDYKMENLCVGDDVHAGSRRASMTNVMQAGSLRRDSMKNIMQADSFRTNSMRNVMPAGTSRRDSMKNIMQAGTSRRDSMKNVMQAGTSRRDSMKNVMQAGTSRRDSMKNVMQADSSQGAFFEITINSSGKSPQNGMFSASSNRFKTAKNVGSAGTGYNVNNLLRHEHAVLQITLPNQVRDPGFINELIDCLFDVNH